MIEQIEKLIQNLNNLSQNQIRDELINILIAYKSSKTPSNNYLKNFSETKESLNHIKDLYKSDVLKCVLFNDLTQSILNQVDLKSFSYSKVIYDYQILLNMFEQLKVIDEKIYVNLLSHSSLNLLSTDNHSGSLLTDDQLCHYIDNKSLIIGSGINSHDKINLCFNVSNYYELDQITRNNYQIQIKEYAEKMLNDHNLFEIKQKVIQQSTSIHRIPDGFIFDVCYSTSDKEFDKRKNDKHKVAFFIEKFKSIGYDYYKTFENEVRAQNFIDNFNNIKFKFENK